ncbi:MAG: hypothetical protein ACRDPT_09965 [Streptomycetales bacterium]
MRAGGSYLIGERGPAIFEPAVAGVVIPNHRIGSAAGPGGGGSYCGGGKVSVQIDLTGGDQELRRRITKIARVQAGGNVQSPSTATAGTSSRPGTPRSLVSRRGWYRSRREVARCRHHPGKLPCLGEDRWVRA